MRKTHPDEKAAYKDEYLAQWKAIEKAMDERPSLWLKAYGKVAEKPRKTTKRKRV